MDFTIPEEVPFEIPADEVAAFQIKQDDVLARPADNEIMERAPR